VLWASVESSSQPPTLPDHCTGLRSIAMHCEIDKAIEAFKTHRPSIQQASDSSTTLEGTTLEGDDQSLAFGDNENPHRIIALFQQSGEHTTNCHILVDEHLATEQRIAISRWCESVRRQAELDS